MTRDQQVKAALAILKPNAVDREQCRVAILKMIDIVDEETENEMHPLLLASKPTKARVEVLRNALVRVTQKNFPKVVKDIVFKDQDVQDYIAACDKILNYPTNRSKQRAVRKRLAAAGAQALFFDNGIKPAVTRRGPWDRLAAILYGDPKANMFPYIRELKDIYDIL